MTLISLRVSSCFSPLTAE